MWYFGRTASCVICDTTFEKEWAAVPPGLFPLAGGDPFRGAARRREAAFDARSRRATGSFPNGSAAGLRPVAGRRIRRRTNWVGHVRFEWRQDRWTPFAAEVHSIAGIALWCVRRPGMDTDELSPAGRAFAAL